ncbi:hypothetical protein ACHAWF_000502, partial [Thalassiosira exigua]
VRERGGQPGHFVQEAPFCGRGRRRRQEEAKKDASSRSSTSSSSNSRLLRSREARRSRVTACPEILVHARDRLRDEFFVLACDGLWDVLGNRECVGLVRSLMRVEGETDAGLACEEVLDTALELDSKDNMTCCLVVFPAAWMGRRSGREDAGVSGRRRDRARAWGRDSTPAGKARARAEERKRKERRKGRNMLWQRQGGAARQTLEIQTVLC